MLFERFYGSDYYILPDKELMTRFLREVGDDNLLLSYVGAIKYHNLRLLSGKDVEENLHRIIRYELKFHSLLKKMTNVS